MRRIYLCRTADIYWRTCVVVKQIESNQSVEILFKFACYHLKDHHHADQSMDQIKKHKQYSPSM